jgi:lipopolysaccharide/colanic/teichoic acid biosynthesis glycosyltransferase
VSKVIQLAVKRALDIAVSGTVLLILLPTMAILAVAIRLTMGSPVLFRQTRPGYNGRPFEVQKFRTMRDAFGPDDRPLPEAERLTRLGYLLRKTSLDELPQLWTIFKGDMSLVGPRPLLMEYLPYYSPEQARRHDVKPGLTGWAQVHGRTLLDFDERFRYDVWYVDHWSLLLDLRIIVMTAGRAIGGQGVPPPEHQYYHFTGSTTTPPEEQQPEP